MEIILFQLAFALCAFSTAGYLLSLVIKKVALARISTWVLAITSGFLTINLFLAVINSTGHAGFNSREFFSFCAWAIMGIYLVFQMKTKTRLLGAFISPVILLLMISAAGQEAGNSIVPESMRSWLTVVHMVLVIAGEALFILASGAGAMFIIQNSLLKHKKLSRMNRLLPALNDLDRINHLSLLWGFPVLTLGIFAGIVFARFTWESGWLADPKIIWTFVVWATYGFLLHQRMAIGWKGIRMAVMSCGAFLLFLISYSGVRFCFSTLHDFI
ncbi:MAG: inner membrane protein YpjD [Smithellaceae bacterium]